MGLGGLSKVVSAVSGGSVGGSVLNDALGVSQSQQQQYEYNRELQELSQEWQEKMSNTAYQRSVNDLTQAGLNPLLSYASGGASTGSSSSPGTGSGTAGAGQALMSLMSSFMSAVGSGQYSKNTATAQRQRISNRAFKKYVDNIFKMPVSIQQAYFDRMFSNDNTPGGQLFRTISSAMAGLNNSGKSLSDFIPEKKSPSTYEQKTRSSGWSVVRQAGKNFLNRKK